MANNFKHKDISQIFDMVRDRDHYIAFSRRTQMNLGLPYKGSKNRIAQKLLDVMPSGSVFVDLFCGGCAVTHAAIISGKYKRFICNDIDGAIPRLSLTVSTESTRTRTAGFRARTSS